MRLARTVSLFFATIIVTILAYNDWFKGLPVWQQFLSIIFLLFVIRVAVLGYIWYGEKKEKYEREGGGEGLE